MSRIVDILDVELAEGMSIVFTPPAGHHRGIITHASAIDKAVITSPNKPVEAENYVEVTVRYRLRFPASPLVRLNVFATAAQEPGAILPGDEKKPAGVEP